MSNQTNILAFEREHLRWPTADAIQSHAVTLLRRVKGSREAEAPIELHLRRQPVDLDALIDEVVLRRLQVVRVIRLSGCYLEELLGCLGWLGLRSSFGCRRWLGPCSSNGFSGGRIGATALLVAIALESHLLESSLSRLLAARL